MPPTRPKLACVRYAIDLICAPEDFTTFGQKETDPDAKRQVLNPDLREQPLAKPLSIYARRL